MSRKKPHEELEEVVETPEEVEAEVTTEVSGVDPEAVEEAYEEVEGCNECGVTALDGSGADARACKVCNGSPFGEPEED